MAADDWRTKSTAPMSFPVTVRGGGFHSEADAKGFATIVATCIRVFGCSLNLTSLDSVTIATEDDYTQSLLELDRGVETRSMLSPTKEDHAYGVAMTPIVLRNGIVKSAMFLRTEFILPLNNSEPASYAGALHLLYHECAHVEVSMTLDRAFPNFVLRPISDFVRSLKWLHLLPCWDEFAACYLSAKIGDSESTLSGYMDTFRRVLHSTRGEIEDRMRAYRNHGNDDVIMHDMFTLCGDLLKFGSYLLGALSGQGRSWTDLEEVEEVVSRSWFKPYLVRLDRLLNEIMGSYGKWDSLDRFDALGDLIEDVVAENGLFLTRTEDGGAYVHVSC